MGVFEVKREDFKVEIQGPPEEEKHEEINIEGEFTIIERQLIFFYMQFEFRMISHQQYFESISSLGYTEESLHTLIESKSHALESFETQFKYSVSQEIHQNLGKLQGFKSEWVTEIESFFSSDRKSVV